MKRSLIVIYLFVFAIVGFAQADSTLSPSSRFKIFPPANFLMPDSITIFTKSEIPKNKQVMLMVFNPDCDHCQHETEGIIKNIQQFKGIEIIMATLVSITEMNQFIEKYKLHQFQNIKVVKDISYFLPAYFQFHNLPFLAFYDKKLKLISEFSGSLPIEKVLKEFGK